MQIFSFEENKYEVSKNKKTINVSKGHGRPRLKNVSANC